MLADKYANERYQDYIETSNKTGFPGFGINHSCLLQRSPDKKNRTGKQAASNNIAGFFNRTFLFVFLPQDQWQQ